MCWHHIAFWFFCHHKLQVSFIKDIVTNDLLLQDCHYHSATYSLNAVFYYRLQTENMTSQRLGNWALQVVHSRIFVTHLRVLEPHLQPLHSHETCLFVATRGCEQTKQVSGYVVHRLPAVQLIPEDVKHVVLHTLCKFVIPTARQRVRQKTRWFRNSVRFLQESLYVI